jgi:hypothetical protein
MPIYQKIDVLIAHLSAAKEVAAKNNIQKLVQLVFSF